MKANKFLLIVGLAIVITMQFSCMNYYRISKTPQNRATPDTTINANLTRYFILRSGDSAYHISNLKPEDKLLTCVLETLPPEHRLHLSNGRNGNMRFKKYKPEAVVLDEAHIYIQQDDTAKPGDNYTLRYDKIQKIEVLEKNKGRTTVSYILGGICITVPILAIGVLGAIGASWSY